MKVWHMSGAGNDFMVIDARGLQPDFPALARKLCALTHADGFMAVDNSRIADFKLHFYNSDGSRGEMCGNGSRCICRYAFDRGIAGEEMTIETDAGPVYGWRLSREEYRVRLPAPRNLSLSRLPGVDYVEVGVPHAVVELPGLTWEQREALRPRAQELRRHPAFPKGANVDFFTWLADGTLRVLTYERGVEDYTLACGTGCGSIAAVLSARGSLPEGKLLCRNPGGELRVRVNPLLLEGPAAVLEILELPD